MLHHREEQPREGDRQAVGEAGHVGVVEARIVRDAVVGVAREDRADDGDDEHVIAVSSDDMTRMGLDVWSERDQSFVEELASSYFDRAVQVQGGQIDCCGVRIC